MILIEPSTPLEKLSFADLVAYQEAINVRIKNTEPQYDHLMRKLPHYDDKEEATYGKCIRAYSQVSKEYYKRLDGLIDSLNENP